jgi:hypothetical protein
MSGRGKGSKGLGKGGGVPDIVIEEYLKKKTEIRSIPKTQFMTNFDGPPSLTSKQAIDHRDITWSHHRFTSRDVFAFMRKHDIFAATFMLGNNNPADLAYDESQGGPPNDVEKAELITLKEDLVRIQKAVKASNITPSVTRELFERIYMFEADQEAFVKDAGEYFREVGMMFKKRSSAQKKPTSAKPAQKKPTPAKPAQKAAATPAKKAAATPVRRKKVASLATKEKKIGYTVSGDRAVLVYSKRNAAGTETRFTRKKGKKVPLGSRCIMKC